VKYLDKEQQLALLQAIGRNLNIAYTRYPKRWRTHQRDASVVIFLLDTGLRIHEALNLRMKDLDIDKQKGRVTVREKGKVSRSVPLSTEALKALKVWLSVRGSLDNEYVWVAVEPKEATDNMALSARTLQKIVLRAGQDADLPHLTPNILRYTFAKNLVDRGVGLEKVAALLGVGLRTAALAYFAVSKPSDDDLEQAIAKI